MKSFLVLVSTFILATSAFAQKTPTGVTYDAQILRVSDGDTVVFAAPFLPEPLKPQLSLRVFGVDTPEKGHRAQCPQENEKALAASKYTKDFVNSGADRKIVLYGWDKYGGRVLGDLLINGQSLRQGLITNGHAREYYGEAKQSWCN